MSLYLAIDLGTTGMRSMIFDGELNQLSYSYEEYGLITPREGWVEQDAELWWELLLKTARAAIEKAGVSASRIKSIAVSSQGITLVPVDGELRPLCNAISWLDVRAERETERIKRDFGDRLFAITGKPTLSAYTLPKLLWLKENDSETYGKAYKFLMPCDFLVARMCAKCVTESSMASGTLMYDLKGGRWCAEILDKYGIDERKLPEIAVSTDKAGCVTLEFAKLLGLSPDCVVAVGAQDQKCAAFGAGLCDGAMTVSLGTAAAVTKLWRKPEIKNTGVGWCGYVEKDSFVTEGVIATAGTCLRFVRDMFFKGEDYDVINKEAEEAMERGCSLIFHPYLGGPSSPDYYPDSIANLFGLNLSTQRGDVALSVMEGVAFNLRSILGAMDAYGNVDKLVLFGGGSKGDLWCRIIAGATGIPTVTLTSPEAAGAGAARIAAMAVGVNLPPLKEKEKFLPQNIDYYNGKYEKYLNIEKRLFGG